MWDTRQRTLIVNAVNLGSMGLDVEKASRVGRVFAAHLCFLSVCQYPYFSGFAPMNPQYA